MALNFPATGLVPDVAVLSDGSIVVAWSAGAGTGAFAGSQSVYAQRFSAAGVAQTGPILVSNQFESGLPEVMATADGGFIVTSRISDFDGTEDRGYVWFTFDASSTMVGGVHRVTPNQSGAWSYGSDGLVAVNNYIVSVAHFGNGAWDVGLNVIDSTGATVFQGLVPTNSAGTQFASEARALADGKSVLVTWSDASGQLDPNGYGVYARVFSTETMSFVTPTFLVNQDTSGNEVATGGFYEADTYALSALADGGFAIFWFDSSSGDVQGRFFNGAAEGYTPRTDEFVATTTTSGVQHFVDAVTMPGGNVTIVFASVAADGTTSVMGREFNPDGTVTRDEFLIATTSEPNARPRVSAVSDSQIVVTWQSGVSVADPQGKQIHVQTVDLAPAPPLPTSFSTSGLTPDVAVLSDGTIAVVWSAGFGTGAFSNSQSIYVQRFSADGAALSTPILVSNQFEAGLPDVMPTANGGFIISSRIADFDGVEDRGFVWFEFDASNTMLGGVNRVTPNQSGSGAWSYGSDGLVAVNNLIASVSHSGNGAWDVGLSVIDSTGVTVFQGAVPTSSAGTQFAAEVKALSDGKSILVTWSDDSGQLDPSGYGVYARVFSTETMSFVTPPFLVNQNTAGNEVAKGGVYEADTYALSALADGGFAIFWFDSSNGDVQGRFFNGAAEGYTPRTDEFVATTTTSGVQHFVDAVTMPGGNVTIVFASVAADGTTSVMGREFNPDGTVTRDEFLIATTSEPNARPRVSAVSDSQVVVTWQSGVSVADPLGKQIHVQTVDLAPAPPPGPTTPMFGPELLVNGSFEMNRDHWPITGTGVSSAINDGMWTFAPDFWVNFVEAEAFGIDNVPGWTTAVDLNGNRGNFDTILQPFGGTPGFFDGATVLELDGFRTSPEPQPLGDPMAGGSHGYVKQVLASPTTGASQLAFSFSDRSFPETSDFGVFVNDQLVGTFSQVGSTWTFAVRNAGGISISMVDRDPLDGAAGWKNAAIHIAEGFGPVSSIGFQAGVWTGSGFDPFLQQDDGGAIIDAVSLKQVYHPVTGTEGNDVLFGTLGADRIDGGNGDDWLLGSQGDDILIGGSGRDEIWYTGAGTYFPGAVDTISSGVVVNLLTGTATGGGGNDTLFGIEDVVGSNFDDLLIGNDGSNYLGGANGTNVYDAGLGDDIIDDGGPSTGTAAYWSALSSVTINLATNSATGGAGNDILLNVENATGSSFADSITGNGGANVLDGADGDDTLRGDFGDDTLIGGLGNDTAVFSGHRSAYAIAIDGAGDVSVSGADGTDVTRGVELFQFDNGVFTLAQLMAAAPIASDAVENTAEDVAVSGNVQAVDANGDPLTFGLVMGPAHGALTFDESGSWHYTPDAGFSGTDGFQFTASDGLFTSNAASVSISVTPVNDGAGIVVVNGLLRAGETLSAQLGADPDGAGGTVAWQWLRNGEFIVGATAATYQLSLSDVDARISVSASYTDGQGFGEPVISDETAVIGRVVSGTNAADILAGSDGDDLINGLGGSDTIQAGKGGDSVQGGNGNDVFVASLLDGNDTYDGGFGSDTYNLSALIAAVTVDLGAGTAVGEASGTDILIGIENVTGGAGNDFLTGSLGQNVISGGAGNDTLLAGASGIDLLAGGTGDDTYHVDRVSGVTTQEAAGEGNDTVLASVTVTLRSNIENLILTGTQAVNGSGNASDNVITGNTAANVLSGNGGNDRFVMFAADGNDTVSGGSGSDTIDFTGVAQSSVVDLVAGLATGSLTGTDILQSVENVRGGTGSDRFVGGAGTNVFTGAEGNDVFVWLSSGGVGNGGSRDVITDFMQGADLLDFSAIDANTRLAGNQAFQFLEVAGTPFSGIAGQLRFEHVGANTILSADTNGDRLADFQLQLSGHVVLLPSDLVP